MRYTIEYLPAYPLAYMRRTGPYGAENAAVMSRLKAWASAHGLEEGIIFGIPQDNPQQTPGSQCRYDVAVVVEAGTLLDEAVQKNFFQEGQYAIFQFEHTAEGVLQGWQGIATALSQAGYQIADRPIVERYRSELVAAHLCELCVPIQSS